MWFKNNNNKFDDVLMTLMISGVHDNIMLVLATICVLYTQRCEWI